MDLLKIQSELKAPKSKKNTFGNYTYRSCEDIYEAVKPLLKEAGITLTLTDELVCVGERYYVKATAKLSDGKEVICTTAYARESENKKGMDDSQITGTASSYARKYALNGLFLIDDTKDADTDEYHKEVKAKAEPPKEAFKPNYKPTAEDVKKLLEETNSDTTAFLLAVGNHFKAEIKSIDEMDDKQLAYAYQLVMKKKGK